MRGWRETAPTRPRSRAGTARVCSIVLAPRHTGAGVQMLGSMGGDGSSRVLCPPSPGGGRLSVGLGSPFFSHLYSSSLRWPDLLLLGLGRWSCLAALVASLYCLLAPLRLCFLLVGSLSRVFYSRCVRSKEHHGRDRSRGNLPYQPVSHRPGADGVKRCPRRYALAGSPDSAPSGGRGQLSFRLCQNNAGH